MKTKRATVTAGAFRNTTAYVRFGDGPRPLVVLTGMTLDNHPPGRLAARAYGYGFRRLAAEHTVYIVHRRRGLAAGATGQDLAADYATILAEELGPVRLMGFSSGGVIAQHLALEHPALVDRLILVVTGARLSPRGREICRRWRDLAQQRRWRRLRGELAAAAVDGAGKQRIASVLGSLLPGGKPPTPSDAADFLTVIDIDLAHDTTRRLPELDIPTLVVGGGDDPFFPQPVLRATADAIPRSVLRVYPGVGHGLPKHHGKRLQADIGGFLSAAQGG